eukprot:UN02943
MIQISLIFVLAINSLHATAQNNAPNAVLAAAEAVFDCVLFECDNWSDALCDAQSANYDEAACNEGNYCCSGDDEIDYDEIDDTTGDIVVSLDLSKQSVIYLWVFVVALLVVNSVLFYFCYYKKPKGVASFETTGGLQV